LLLATIPAERLDEDGGEEQHQLPTRPLRAKQTQRFYLSRRRRAQAGSRPQKKKKEKKSMLSGFCFHNI